MLEPNITRGQIAIDPRNGVLFYKDGSGNLMKTTLSFNQDTYTDVSTDDVVTFSTDVIIDGNLTINGDVSTDDVLTFFSDVIIDGNLTVNGDTVTVNAAQLYVEDNIIILNSNIAESATPSLDAGIEINRGNLPNVAIKWNETLNRWEYTNDGVDYIAIGSGGGGGGSVEYLNDIGDVSTTSAVSGEYLKFNGTNWVNATIQLGTNTSGDYIESLVAGTGVTISNDTGEGSQPTIAIGQDVSTGATPNFARVIAPLTGNVSGNLTGNVTGNLLGNVTGNVTGTVSSISNHGINDLSDVVISGQANGDFLRYQSGNWINDAVNLSTDTVGDYVSKLAAGTGVTITNNSGEGATPNISIGQAVGTTDTVTFNVVNADLTGDVTGTVSDISNHTVNDLSDVVISDPANGDFLRYQAGNWINDPVNLSTDTVGDYVKNLVAGTNVTITNNSGEGATPTISFTGNTTNIDSISSPDFIQFDTTYTPVSQAVGKLQWDQDWGTLQFGLPGGNVNLQIGQEQVALVYNSESTTLQGGEVVYVYGAHGGMISVKRASNSGEYTSTKTLGVVTEAINASGTGYVTTFGIVNELNLSAYQPGDVLWLGNTAGTFTKVKPTAPNHLVFVGVVIRNNSGNGAIFVKPQNGYELDELHNVDAATPNSGDVLTYNGSLWEPVALAFDHGNLTGLSDDDHTQYLNTARHDALDHTAAMSTVVLDDISNVAAATPSTNEVLSWNGSAWVSRQIGPTWNTVLGTNNLAAGSEALMVAQSGSYTNIAIGAKSLRSNTTGSDNIAIGYESLVSNTIGTHNIAIGRGAIAISAAAEGNIGIGGNSLNSYTAAGYGNVGVGYNGLAGLTAGSANTAVGYNAMGFGDGARAENTVVGESSFYNTTTGSYNVGLGRASGLSNTTGSNNVALGTYALFSNSTGSRNVAIGYNAGANETGSDKLYVANTDTSNPLIYGDFSSSLLRVNGSLEVTSSLSLTGSNGIVFEGATPDSYETTLNVVEPTADRTILLPNASGTLSLEDNSGWTSFTPSLKTNGDAIILGNGTMVASYKQIGKTVHVKYKFTIGSTTSIGANEIVFGLPVTAANANYNFTGAALDNGNAWYQLTAVGHYLGLTTEFAMISYSGTGKSSQGVTNNSMFSLLDGDYIVVSGTYEAA